jgi:hypothetical protein
MTPTVRTFSPLGAVKEAPFTAFAKMASNAAAAVHLREIIVRNEFRLGQGFN